MAANETEQKVSSAEEVGGDETILRTPLRKAVFLGGLALALIVGLFLSLHGGR